MIMRLIGMIVLGLAAGCAELFLIYAAYAKKSVLKAETYREIYGRITSKDHPARLSMREYIYGLAVILATAGMYVAIFYKYTYFGDKIVTCFTVSIMTVVALLTVRDSTIPKPLLAVSAILSIIAAAGALRNGFAIFIDNKWWNPIVGGLAGFLTILIVSLVAEFFRHSEKISFGDAKILGIIGILLGWRLLPIMMITSFILMTLAGFIITAAGLMKGHVTIPYAPVAAVSTIFTVFFGTYIYHWYTGTFM